MTNLRSPKVFFGITGGIASGKSTVSRRFRERGIPVLDADVLAREAVAPGSEGLNLVVKEFGQGILKDEGELDRKKLGDIVFRDPDARMRLELILDPEIEMLALLYSMDLQSQGHEVVGYEAAILVEKGLHVHYKPLVLVTAPEVSQVSRAIVRDSSTEEKIRARMAAQLPVEEKRKVADYIIENDSDLATLHAKADAVLDKILASV